MSGRPGDPGRGGRSLSAPPVFTVSSRFSRTAALLALCVAAPLAAQSAPTGGPPGAITGVVYDSLVSQRPLVDAEVLVAGTSLTARTDAAGRFLISGVPAGAQRVTFFHPLLESLNFGAPTQLVDVRPGRAQEVRLLTPSAATVFRAFCTAESEVKTGVLVGRVRAPDTTVAVAGADVRLAWNVFTVERRGLVRAPRTLAVRTNADGSYFVCGVPTDVPVQVRVQTPDGVVAASDVALGDRPFGTAYFDLPSLPAVDTAAAAARPAGPSGGAPRAPAVAYVAGVVRRADGSPFVGARVVIPGQDAVGVTGADGAFVVPSTRDGALEVEARAIGYRPVRIPVTATRGTPARVALTLTDNVVVLAATSVRAPRVAAALADFERRRRGAGGYFITSQAIEQRRPFSIADVLSLAPGVRTVLPDAQRPGASPRIIFTRSAGQAGVMQTNCEPVAYVDGVRLIADPEQGLQLEQVIPRPQDVYGIEVYASIANAPPQYQPLNSSCGVILFWTNRGR